MNQFAAGIDIGGTKTAIGLVSAKGALLARREMPTRDKVDCDVAAHEMIDVVAALIDEVGGDRGALAGVGIGCAGPLDAAKGEIRNMGSLHRWFGCRITQPFEEAFGVPVRLENDADTALFGEVWQGAACGYEQVVMLTLGTGVGGAAMIAGDLLRGESGRHPEIGHMLIDPAGPPCYCGQHGCLESLASGTGIGNAGRAAGFADARDVFARADAGDAIANTIVDRALNACARAATTLCLLYVPQAIVLGGGIADHHYDRFRDPIQHAMVNVGMYPDYRGEVVKAQLGNHAGVIGGAWLGFHPR